MENNKKEHNKFLNFLNIRIELYGDQLLAAFSILVTPRFEIGVFIVILDLSCPSVHRIYFPE